MSQVITNAFEQYWQSSLAAEQPVVLDEFILADIPNLDINAPIDPDTGLPPAGQIVHRQTVDQRGRINNNAVAYTIVMDTTVGDFSFNAMYLRNKTNGVIGMIVYKGRENKLKTDQTTGQTGTSLVKSMLMGYDQAAEATITHVDAGTWQIDYAARLRGMDEDIRQLQADLYGHNTFVGDGFKVVEKDGAYQVTPGVAIVGGLRVELKQPEIIHPGTKQIGVWVDVHRSGSLLSEHQNHFTIITSVADLADHVDSNGYPHYVAKLGTVKADSTVIDDRGQGGSGGSGAIPDTLALWKRSMAEAGYDLIGQFGTALIIEASDQVVLSKSGKEVYAWMGELPKEIPIGATPENTGGMGSRSWNPINHELLRKELTSGGSDITSIATLEARLVDTDGYKLLGDSIVVRLSALKERFGVAAWAQAANYRIFHIDVDDEKSHPYIVPNGQTIILDAAVTHEAPSKCFDFTNSSGWRLTGNGELRGGTTRPLEQSPTHFGLYIQDCFRYSIDGNITVKYFGAVGMYGDGSSETSGDVSFSSVRGLRCEENYVNYQLLNGFQQEYTTFVSCWGIRATLANGIVETGNIYWLGGGLSHGYGDGIRLQQPSIGGNPHHGIFSGCEFNHNQGHNLLADKIAYGMNFANCSWFSGGASESGDIYINSSRGVNLDGGILGCDVRVIEDTREPHTGWNSIKNMHVFNVDWSNAGARIITGGSFSRNKLSIKNNFTNDGMWRFNDVGGAGVYANYRAADNIQITSAAQTLKFTSKMRDDRNCYDINTGFFTAPFAGVLRARACLHLLTNSNVQTAGHNLLFFRDDDGTGSAFTQLGKAKPVADGGNAMACVDGTFEIPVSAGAKILMQYQAPDFSTQLCDIDMNNSYISFEMM